MQNSKLAAEDVAALPLSNDSVRRRIEKISCDLEERFCDILNETTFCLSLDESTVRDSKALVLAFARCAWNRVFVEEMLFCESMKATTKAQDIFETVMRKLNDKNIPLQNIVSVAGGGAPAMTGRRSGLIQLLKSKVSGLIGVHCVIHRIAPFRALTRS